MKKLKLADAAKVTWIPKPRPRPDLGLQGRNGQGQPDRPVPSPYSIGKGKRWSSPSVPGTAVMRNTKAEAIAWFKQHLGVDRLPRDMEITGEEV